MTTQNVTCVQCPMGCSLSVVIDKNGQVEEVRGNGCPRGKAYGISEVTHPVRVVTSLMRVAGESRPISVRTSDAVPREMISEVLEAIHTTVISAPVHMGEILIKDVAGCSIDVVATKDSVGVSQ